jgi:hypothetical protein
MIGGSHYKDLAGGMLQAISNEIDNGRVKVLDWLSTGPLELLQSGGIVCLVHCGGSNSFHEALRHISFQDLLCLTSLVLCSAGVPQVIVPCWLCKSSRMAWESTEVETLLRVSSQENYLVLSYEFWKKGRKLLA